MEYNVALRLKEAGFPQKNQDWCEEGCAHDDERCLINLIESDKPAYRPTLEELIEACPKEYNGQVFDLCYLPDGQEWVAWYEAPNQKILPSVEGLGSTPSEAVASLWLALHGKEKGV